VHLSNNKFNLILLISIISISLLSISWHHKTYTLYKKIKHEGVVNNQATALNKQLLSEQSQVMSGSEIKEIALKNLNMKEIVADDIGKWYQGRLAL
jgi:cell division protein FtsL